jgi:uncharacterized protein (TIGR02996 family)
VDTLTALLATLGDSPTDDTTWRVLADWLEENNRPSDAELARLRLLLASDLPADARDAALARQRDLLRQGVRPCVPQRTVSLADGVDLTLALVAPGRFLLGSPGDEPERYSDEGPRRKITLTRAFYLGIYPVTQAQWLALMRTRAGHFRTDENNPVESISWDQARQFCARLGEQAGQVCRLPTEAEWEYACRAGTITAYYTGDTVKDLDRAGWYDCHNTNPVGRLEPNAWGLYDMHGNVMEWCLDWYESRAYADIPAVNPAGPDTGTSRVLRGGAWCYSAKRSRSAYRSWNGPGEGSNHIGFRVLMEQG